MGICAAALSGAALLPAGCTTYGDWRTQQDLQAQEDQRLQEERDNRLRGELERLALENQSLRDDLDLLRRQMGEWSQTQGRAAQGQTDDFARRLAALEAARTKDRQELLDALSKRMADLLAGSRGSSSGGARRPAGGGSSGGARGGVGYEHEVKPGETLSAIAQAYGVSVKDIMAENNLRDAALVRAGQKLFIPKKD